MRRRYVAVLEIDDDHEGLQPSTFFREASSELVQVAVAASLRTLLGPVFSVQSCTEVVTAVVSL